MTKRVDTTVRKRVNAAMGKRVDAFNTEPVDIPMTSLRLAACRCGGSGPMDVAFHRLDNQDEYHINSRFACLQTARALMLPDSTSFESSDAYVAELDAILSNLVDSSLLQSCAFGPELLSICRALFSSEEIWVFFSQARSGLTRLGRREKLLEWFKTFPDEYTEEVRNLRAEFESIFSD
ncbi:hypothetical protein V5O48_010565 [Marasmius crinis-equi]|uniref:Uncharacterized protein n=1 Tax=Marasmius crinis-equi TaxID=585013 RepID=A0ABR3F801_9AGAR